MAYLKTEAPVFRDGEGIEGRVAKLSAYASQLQRELEYVLTHIGSGNMNGRGLAIGVTDSEGNAMGSIGKTSGGVGLEASGASVAASKGAVTVAADGAVTISGGAVTIWAGAAGLRLTDGCIEATADGKTWQSLMPEEEEEEGA